MVKSKQLFSASAIMVCLLLATSHAEAGLMRADVPDSAYLAYAQDPAYQASGWFGRYDANGDLSSFASGVAIAGRWVVTAGHVVDDLIYSGFRFGVGSNALTDPGNSWAVSEVFLYPGYEGGWGGTKDDIALCLLESPIQGIVPTERFYGTDQIGTHVSIVGHGAPATPITGVLPDDGNERGGENFISRIGSSNIGVSNKYLIIDFSPVSSPWETLPLEITGTSGDSGGGWYNDLGELVALSNFEWANSSLTGGIRISQYNDWIDTTIAQNTTVPEPSSLMILTSLLGTLAASRKLRKLVVS
jgi:hypothetical protein